MHDQFNSLNWRNLSIKLNWLTWLNNQTSENSETAEIAQCTLNGMVEVVITVKVAEKS